MPTTVHRTLKTISFNVNSIDRQAYEDRKQLQGLKIDVALFSVTHRKPHMRFYITDYDIYRTDRGGGHKGGTAMQLRRAPAHMRRITPSPISGSNGFAYRFETLKCSLQPFINLRKDWSDTDIIELFGFRNKSILAGDLDAKHPVWNSRVSTPSDLKLLELFVSSDFEISASQCSMHYTPDDRGDFRDIVIHQNVRLSEVIFTGTRDADHLPIMFCILDPVRMRGTFLISFLGYGGVRLNPRCTSVTNWPVVPAPDDR
jgi:hypothetical protein